MAIHDHDKAPVFLVGAERSGTTVLRLMLGHHPEIAWQSEFEFSIHMVSDEGNWPDLETYYEWLSTDRIFLSNHFTINRDFTYPELVRDFSEQRRHRERKPRIGATVHHHFDRLLYLWPEASFLHIVRDGRDVARSAIAMGWAGNAWTGVQGWMDAEALWGHLCEIVPETRRFELKYEELMANPIPSLTSLCEYINVVFDPAMLKYPEDTTYDPPDPSLCYQWREKMTTNEVQLAESRIGPMLIERGYELSDFPPITVTSWKEKALRLHDRAARSRFRIRRYGWRLFLADFVARRLPPTRWRKQVRLKMNEIETAHLK